MHDRIPVIYVLSNGRSGTTLLDMLLGAAPKAWTLGEAQLLRWELHADEHDCGCGAPLDSCSFWRPILPEIPLEDGEYPIDHFRRRQGAGRVIRWRLLADVLSGRTGGWRKAAAVEYGALNARYLQAVRGEAQRRAGRDIRWLIDSSMDPYRLLWLADSGFFDLRVVHLTKAPPGFVYSMVKPELPGGLVTAFRMAARWLLENAMMIRLCRTAFPDGSWRHVRYEDLAGRPGVVRCTLADWLDLDLPDWEGRTFRAYENHAIAGNEMRWQDTEIRLDQRWKTHLPPAHLRMSRALTAPLAGALGY